MDLWIPFYDQIFDYFSTYFWLYHPGDPDHSAYREIWEAIWAKLIHIWSKSWPIYPLMGPPQASQMVL